ncbi:hypothetical protein [Gordonia crocea]|uniref:ABC transporter substrate-binding protein n=1 Tax=Gordonia crocea TaxID=589162 RepID=A0A7I9UX66_9ACTN|nr:hypothetical protein [Gordonia crocea]GED97411.1 hypothetical protein nbrc107697_14500 [Gordonia crocea]
MVRWLTVIGVVGLILCGCSAQAGPDPVRIGASSDPQMQMAAALYRGALRAQGMAVETPIRIAGERAQLDAMSADDIDLFPSTVPVLLAVVLPEGRIATETANGEPTEFGDAAYTLLSRSLPVGAAVGDPVSGEQLVPVYRALRFGRNDVKALNKVAGELSLPDLAALTRAWQGGKDQAALVSDWLSQHGLG